MIYKIAIKNKKLFACGIGKEVFVPSGYDTIENYDNDSDFQKRLEELKND